MFGVRSNDTLQVPEPVFFSSDYDMVGLNKNAAPTARKKTRTWVDMNIIRGIHKQNFKIDKRTEFVHLGSKRCNTVCFQIENY